jgi:hypothetical protein
MLQDSLSGNKIKRFAIIVESVNGRIRIRADEYFCLIQKLLASSPLA